LLSCVIIAAVTETGARKPTISIVGSIAPHASRVQGWIFNASLMILKRTIHAKLVVDREGKRAVVEREYKAWNVVSVQLFCTFDNLRRRHERSREAL